MSEQREAFESALNEYWELAFAEGARNGRYDTENGDAQRVRSQLVGMFAALSSAPSAEPVNFDASDTNFSGVLVPLYEASILSAAIAAAREQDAQTCDQFSRAETCASKIRALQTDDGLAALREMLIQMAYETLKERQEKPGTLINVEALADRVLKGE